MFNPQSRLFIDPKIEYPINNLDLNFNNYIQQCKAIIANTRLDLKQKTAHDIIDANAPFELRPLHTPIKCGALLVHGLFDSPFHLKDIGLALQSQGILVRAVVLPGHGTVPGALLNVNYHQWLKTVHYGISSFENEVDQIFLVGSSTGASLALYYAALHPHKIAGVILLSPALKVHSLFTAISNGYRWLEGIWKGAAWIHKDPQETIDYVKYRSIPYNAIHQVDQLSKAIKKLPFSLPKCPLFFALSHDDGVVCADTIIRYFHQHTNPKSRLVLYTNQTPLFHDVRINTRPSKYSTLNISNLSHIALPIAPTNPHYGKNGNFIYASREENKETIYGEYSRVQQLLNDYLYRLKLRHLHLKRLTYNPDFQYLMDSINAFIVQNTV